MFNGVAPCLSDRQVLSFAIGDQLSSSARRSVSALTGLTR